MNKKLALLGASRPGYVERIKDIFDKYGYCWYGWTYKINLPKQATLDNQDSFHIYVHSIKNPADKSYGHGTGLIEHILSVKKNNYRYNDTPFESPEQTRTPSRNLNRPHRLWVKIIDKPIEIQSRKWNTFRDFDTDVQLDRYKFIQPNVDFEYVIDENI
ncbi:MAG: hypothetical protein NTW30_04430 [Candidatus Aenigmarchaeota archaeon]|nr:hypothetical protein [Candidatus Aenigmarchaeota archaeon]